MGRRGVSGGDHRVFRGTLILSDGRSFPHEAGQVLHITAE